jgi:aryl-alcohol dehydrogenase-like predicted oxidoreductase
MTDRPGAEPSGLPSGEPPAPLPSAELGGSGITVSRMALGSWRTFERISRDGGLAVMRAAREAGITFLDDARYNDETGTAPIATGYSEVVFGELFRAAGWPRASTVVANKLWWEFWPRESPAQELSGSLGRMRFDYIDLIYSEPPPPGVLLTDAVEMIDALIRSGAARCWGTLNWPPSLTRQACQLADRAGLARPVATQPPYSLVVRDAVEDPEMQDLAREQQVAIVASYALAGGILTGKYDSDPRAGRAASSLGRPHSAAAEAAGRQLAALARETGTDPAQLAIAFVLLNPAVTAVLFGATRPAQIITNVAALALAGDLSPDGIQRLTAIGRPTG